MPEIKFTIPGEPCGKAVKIAYNKDIGHALTYNTPKSTNYMTAVRFYASNELPEIWEPLNVPVEVEIIAVIARPRRLLDTFKRTGKLKCGNPGRIETTAKPDVDNITKAVFDGITKSGLWRDDKLVWHEDVRKYYAAIGEAPCTEIIVRWD